MITEQNNKSDDKFSKMSRDMQRELASVDEDANLLNYDRSRQFLNQDLSRERSAKQSKKKTPVQQKSFMETKRDRSSSDRSRSREKEQISHTRVQSRRSESPSAERQANEVQTMTDDQKLPNTDMRHKNPALDAVRPKERTLPKLQYDPAKDFVPQIDTHQSNESKIQSQIKLPKLELATFFGDPKIGFWQS